MSTPRSIKEIPPPPASPSGSVAHDDITASPHHQRHPAPSLSLDALSPLFRSFSPSPSFPQTPSTRFLSPPLSVGSVASPPPRPEADDYLAAGARHASGKGKHHVRREHRTQSPLVLSEESQGSVAPSNITPTPASLAEALKIEPAGTASSNDEGPVFAPPPAGLIIVQPKKQRLGRQLRDSIESLPPDAKANFLPAPLDIPDDTASPAVNALRRLSRTHTQPRDASSVDFGRFSRAMTGTLISVFTGKDAHFLAATGAHSAGLDYGTVHPGRVTFQDDGRSEVRATPATIVLRKASAAPQPRSIVVPCTTSASFDSTRSNEPPLHSRTSSASLLAFDSKHVDKEPHSIPSTLSSLKENDQSPTQRDTPVRRPSLMSEDFLPHKKTRAMTLLGNTAVNRRQSVTAEAALTTAEFFPCPGTLINPSSKPNPRSHEQAAVRTSVVHFSSRNSIHEIIWRENETSSSGSSSSPVSPTNKEASPIKDRSPSRKPSVYVARDRFITSDAEIQSSLGDTTSPLEKSVPPSPAQQEAQEAFLAWSWETPPPPVMNSYMSSHNVHSTFQLGRASTFGGMAAETFSPLGTRRSGFNWRWKSLADTPDPVAGPEERHSQDVSDQDEEFGSIIKHKKKRSRTYPSVPQSDTKVEMGGKTEKGRQASLRGSPFAPARVGEEGSMGSSVGVSSRARVPSKK